MIARIISALALMFVFGLGGFTLTGCHTIEGAGKDVSAAGSEVAETADETRPYDEQGESR